MDDITGLIEDASERLGFKLIELDINDKYKKIRIIIYKTSGVTVEDCKVLGRELMDDIEFID